MNHELLFALAISLVLTLVLESSFFLLIGKRNRKDFLLVVLVNIITNPAVVLTYWLSLLYTDLQPVLVKAILELSAVLAEGYYYQRYANDFRHPYIFSVAANAFSFGIGTLIQLFI